MECKIIVRAGSSIANTLNLTEDTTFDSKQALLDYLNSASRTATNVKSLENVPGITKMIPHLVSNVNAGIQQDATHSTENSNVILPSQMFNAFTFKGYSQREVNEIYSAIADIAVKGLSDTFFRVDRPTSEIIEELKTKGLSDEEAKEEARILKEGEEIDFSKLVASIVESDDKTAKDKMLEAYREILIEKGSSGEEFGLMEVLTTTFNALDIPIDNAHLFKSAVSALANKFTKAAIKIKFDGQFAVLKPGAGSQQVYEITGGRMPYKSGMDVEYRDVIGTEIVTRERAREWAKVNNIDINTIKPRNLQGQYVTIVDPSGNKKQLSMASGEQLIPEARALAIAKDLVNKYKDLAEATDDYTTLYKKFIKDYKALPIESDVAKFVNRYLNTIPDDKLKKTFDKGDVIEKIFVHFNPEAKYFNKNGKGEEIGDRAKLLFLGKINTLGKVLTHELNRFMIEASEGKIPESLHPIEGAINNESGHKIEISRAEVIVDLTARDKYLIREGDDIGDINEKFFFNRLLEKSGIQTPYHGADRMIRSGEQKILFHVGVAPSKYAKDVNDQVDYDPTTNTVNIYGTPEAGNANKLLFSLKGYSDPEVSGKPAPSVRIIDGNMHIFLNLDETKSKNKNRQAAIQSTGDSNYKRVENYLAQQYKIKVEDLSKITEETKQEQIDKLAKRATQMFNSWNKYLDVIGTRIPGQHYQSFQGLRIVGFATGNKIFVPNEVTMLAGSD